MSSKVTTGGKMGGKTAAADRKQRMSKIAQHVKRLEHAAHVAAMPF